MTTMNYFKTKCFFLAVEILLILILACIFFYFGEIFHGVVFEYFNFIISFIPVAAIYFFLRMILNGFFSFLFTVSFVYLLYKVDDIKIKNTGEHISFKDISSYENIIIAKNYIELNQAFGLTVFFILFLFCAFFFLKRVNFFQVATSFFCLFLLAPFILIYSSKQGGYIDRSFGRVLSEFNPIYYSWDIPENIRKNGVLVHMLQTSRALIPYPEIGGYDKFKELKRGDSEIIYKKPRNVYVILCEACWYDNDNFSSKFRPLIDIGFRDFRAVSPIYGGGTVNSAFEMLTGVPSRVNLYGVIYQEYKDELSSEVFGLPRAFKEAGYSVNAFHNFHDNFWNRTKVMPKMGFEKYYGISSMKAVGDYADPFPRDYIMYDLVLRHINDDQYGFFYMETVNSHGGYPNIDEYERRIGNTVSDMVDFVSKVRAKDDEALILIFGDHKPALNSFFKEGGIIPLDYFDGDKLKHGIFLDNAAVNKIGDVPVLILSNDDSVEDFIAEASGGSLFCLSMYFNKYFLKANIPAHKYSEDLCALKKGYDFDHGTYEKWVTYYSIFHYEK